MAESALADAGGEVSSLAQARIEAAHLLTAPLAVVAAGALVSGEGSAVFVSNWNGSTLGLTHFVTLGFVSMTAFVAFGRHLAAHACRRRPGTFAVALAYATLVLGVGSLGWGTLHRSSDFVFLAIAAMGIMGPTFLIGAARGLRGLEAPAPEKRALATALWSFFIVASLGIWVAHGHGGMRFPGPRPMWIQVHLCVGLLGWVGSLLAARLARSPELEPRLLARDMWLRIGLGLPVAVLFAQYFGLIGAAAPTLAAALSLPALYVIWWALPARVLFDPGGRASAPFPSATCAALALGPACAGVGAVAYLSGSAVWVLGFGWLAIWGWAGLCIHGLLVEFAHRGADASKATSRRSITPALALHLASWVAGALAIALTDDALARLTGALLVATGAAIFVEVALALRATRVYSVRSSA